MSVSLAVSRGDTCIRARHTDDLHLTRRRLIFMNNLLENFLIYFCFHWLRGLHGVRKIPWTLSLVTAGDGPWHFGSFQKIVALQRLGTSSLWNLKQLRCPGSSSQVCNVTSTFKHQSLGCHGHWSRSRSRSRIIYYNTSYRKVYTQASPVVSRLLRRPDVVLTAGHDTRRPCSTVNERSVCTNAFAADTNRADTNRARLVNYRRAHGEVWRA